MPKERSPNYPGLSLEAAITAIQRIYDKERRSATPTESVAKALGHENLSGPALMKIAALRQYGLIEDVSRGKVKVSDDAMTVLLRKSDDPEYLEAVRQAALRPSLFTDLFLGYGEASDDSLRFHLIKERGFSEEGATKVIKTFRATISFAKLSLASYNQPDGKVETRSSVSSLGDTFLHADPPGKSRTADMVARETGARRWSAGGSAGLPLNVYLGPGIIAQITFSHGEPTPDDLDALVAQLQLTKSFLMRGAQEPERLRDLEAEKEIP